MARSRYTKTEHGALPGRDPHREGEGGAKTVARVMGKAEAGHAKGAKTTESAGFRLESNRAKHTSGGYEGGGESFTEGAPTIQSNAGE